MFKPHFRIFLPFLRIAPTHGQKNNGYSAFTKYPLSRLPTPSDRCLNRNFLNYFLMSTRVRRGILFGAPAGISPNGDKLRLPGSDRKKYPPAKRRGIFFGAPAGIRTPDTLLKRQVLCLLSYWGISVRKVIRYPKHQTHPTNAQTRIRREIRTQQILRRESSEAIRG